MRIEDLLNEEYKEVNSKYPLLQPPSKVNSGWISKGSIEVIDPEGNHWDTFEVTIHFSSQYPKVPPTIFETGERIPRDPEWHINKNGSCCVGPTPKIIRKLDYQVTWLTWLDLVVMPYLLDQVHRIETGEYAGKVHKHFGRGLLDYYKEWWKIDTDNDVIERLQFITGRRKYPRNKLCFCGSDIKHKRCCRIASECMGIAIEVYRSDLDSLLKEQKSLVSSNC